MRRRTHEHHKPVAGDSIAPRITPVIALRVIIFIRFPFQKGAQLPTGTVAFITVAGAGVFVAFIDPAAPITMAMRYSDAISW